MSKPYPANPHGLSRAMISAMRQAVAPSRAYCKAHDDDSAIAYAGWLARRDGLEVPAFVPSDTQDGVRCIVEREVPAGLDWSQRNMRAKAVRWEEGIVSYTRTETVWRTRKGQRVAVEQTIHLGGAYSGTKPDWHPKAVLLRIEIPNWDHIPTVLDCSDESAEERATRLFMDGPQWTAEQIAQMPKDRPALVLNRIGARP